jgi:protein phosphatase 1B
MGAFLDKPKTDKQTQTGAGNGLRYALSTMQGWRSEMEDAHCAMIGLPGKLHEWSFFAVFDGHAGTRVSAYCAEKLVDAIVSSNEFSSVNGSASNLTQDGVSSGIRSGFLRLDEQLRQLPEMVTGDDKSGSTAVCALISPQRIFLANCGDSRAVLSRAKRVVLFTQDHKPMNPTEKERIQNAGGSVMIQRINGSLAVSRALGDFEYKNVPGRGQCEQLVSPEPEIFVEERNQNMDEFLVLACDGIWDVMTNEELCDFIRDRMQITDDLEAICNCVVDTCLSKGSRDNMSVVIVAFKGAPSVSSSAKQQEAELDARLEAKVKDVIEGVPMDSGLIQYVMHVLSTENIEGLPPGGGLNAKRATIQEIISRLRPSATEKE